MTFAEAQKLRGLLSRHVQCQRALENAGASPPEEAERIRAEAEAAHHALYAYIRELTH